MNKYVIKFELVDGKFYEFEFYAFDEIEARRVKNFIALNRSDVISSSLFRQDWTRLK